MTHRLTEQVRDANRIKAECFQAAVALTEFAINEAKKSEATFIKKYGEPYERFATLTYDEWINNKARAV